MCTPCGASPSPCPHTLHASVMHYQISLHTVSHTQHKHRGLKTNCHSKHSVELFPAVAICRVEGSCEEQNDVHHPPHPHSPQGQQLGNAQTCVAQAEPVHSQQPQEHRVEEDAGEVVAGIPVLAKPLSKEIAQGVSHVLTGDKARPF